MYYKMLSVNCGKSSQFLQKYIQYILPSISLLYQRLLFLSSPKFLQITVKILRPKQNMGKICLFRVRRFDKCNNLSMCAERRTEV
jgi:hypothetical protein